jgi:predicted O-linked N-acetylglucosamine transferase (SPINDLY family)
MLACDWGWLDADEAACKRLVRAGIRGVSPFVLLSLATTPAERLAGARLEASAIAREAGQLPTVMPPRPRDKIRLAYLSGDFRQHAVAVLTAEMFEQHDRGRFEVTAYSFGPDDGSAMRRRLERAFDRFIDVRRLAHADAAQRIRDDGIDILVDLVGYTKGARTAIVARRPAPVQVNFLGYIGTMGAPFIDYVIADAVTLPLGEQNFYDERIVQLPGCFMPRDTKRDVSDRMPSRAECGLPDDGFVFCCFNKSYKITPAVFDIWMRLLHAVPGSVLWLYDDNVLARNNLRSEALRRGVSPERLVFAPYQEMPAHLARHRCADLFLDTLLRNAHTTANLALWSGLPLLTCAGEHFNGRAAASLLTALGMPELVTHSLAEYEALALRIATDPERLAGLRRRLAEARTASPLFDVARYTRSLEAAYLRMWETWSAGKPPEPITIPA